MIFQYLDLDYTDFCRGLHSTNYLDFEGKRSILKFSERTLTHIDVTLSLTLSFFYAFMNRFGLVFVSTLAIWKLKLTTKIRQIIIQHVRLSFFRLRFA